MRIAYFDCFSGISGDMTLGAFIDAGLSIAALRRELNKLKLKGYEIKSANVKRGGISGTKFDCIKKSGDTHSHRSLKEIFAIIDKSTLSEKVKQVSKDIFGRIGAAEAKIHGISPKSDIKLHELGDIDSIIDIVGTAIAIDEMRIDEVHASAVTMGRSSVKTRHGMLPIPAPASLELLKGVPLKISDIDAELVTPTGAGILKTLSKSFGPPPQMKVSDTGYGAGTRDPESGLPNMLRLIIGEAVTSFREDAVHVIETDIDDMNPQNFEYLFEKLFKEGALDVYTTAIQMKKTRPAFKLTVLAKHADLEKMCSIIFSETTTIGVRYYEAKRFKLDRKLVKVKTKYGPVSVKLSGGPGGILTASPEYEECARLARKRNIPLKTICEEARRAVKV